MSRKLLTRLLLKKHDMNQRKSNNSDRRLDLICLGRASVDFYGEQIGSRLEDMSSFAKYLGGSSCNIAFGAARLGLRSAMLTRVGDEQMGQFIREELEHGGVDVSHVKTDLDRPTAIVILGIKDEETFPLIFYRENCADMAIAENDFSPEFIASSKSLLITGTHFSTAAMSAVSMKAIEYAISADTKVVVDIDYRPVLWGLTGRGDGENRFVSSESVSAHLQTVLPVCHLIVGTEEEIRIAGGVADTLEALRIIRSISDATVLLKLGPLGCAVLDGEIPETMDGLQVYRGAEVKVMNVLGAGDAFMAGFLRGWLNGASHEQSVVYANACGALVVSRHGCAPAVPTAEELDYYIQRVTDIPHPDRDTQLNYLHRATTRYPRVWGNIYALAFDHRKQFHEMAISVGAHPERIGVLKRLLVKAVESVAENAARDGNVGVLVDDTYGQQALNEVTGRGWWIGRPVEVPGSRPVELEGGRSIGDRLKSWPREHVVKCLIFYHPTDPLELRLQQERQATELYRACCTSGHELLLEIIPPNDTPVADQDMADTLQRFYNLGIYPDWWKLPSMSRNAWQGVSEVIETRAPHCRGVVMLGLDAPLKELRDAFRISAEFSVCKGFTVGRSLFGEPSRQWFGNEINDDAFVHAVAENYLQLITFWRDRSKDMTNGGNEH